MKINSHESGAGTKGPKKNLSTSPRRQSSSGKKNGSNKSGVNNKKKYLDMSK
jgi:hypothetical protein